MRHTHSRLAVVALAALTVLALAGACAPEPREPRPEPWDCVGAKAPKADAWCPPDSPDPEAWPATDCGRMCGALERLDCPEARPPKGDGCLGTCEHALASGVVNLRVECVVAAKTVAAVRECNVRCLRE